MTPLYPLGTTRVIGKSQGYLGLAIRDTTINCSVNGSDTPAMVTVWEPDPTELAALVAGGTIRICILGYEHPPIMVGVQEVNECPMDAP